MSALKQNLNQATKDAMRARDKERVATLRMVNAEVKRLEVDERRELSDDDIFAILNKMLKQRQDAHGQYQDAGREDLAAIEAYEISVIQTFLPEQMDEDELAAFVAAIISEAGAGGMQDMGKVMGLLKSKGEGRVDMGAPAPWLRHNSAAVKSVVGAIPSRCDSLSFLGQQAREYFGRPNSTTIYQRSNRSRRHCQRDRRPHYVEKDR